ncbi:hypothetical protein LWI28_018646 [Acer negundo]|uniref:Uncharacterized protein n=1 Tax=Acer negundo TaxID=4023 RepID=A0AAD5IMA8_ACENE|nr:hypothetical protein LWI28_018646 [Acer negundo]
MFSIKDVPSTTSVLSAYTAFSATTMLVRTVSNEVQSVTNQLIPKQIKDMILSKFGGHCGIGSRMTLTIDEFDGYCIISTNCMRLLRKDEISRNGELEKRVIALSFHKKYMEKVVSSYLRYMTERSNDWKEENNVVKL